MLKTQLTQGLLAGSPIAEQMDRERGYAAAGAERVRRVTESAVKRGDGAMVDPANALVGHFIKPVAVSLKRSTEIRTRAVLKLIGPERAAASGLAGFFALVMRYATGSNDDRDRRDTFTMKEVNMAVGNAVVREVYAELMETFDRDELAAWREANAGIEEADRHPPKLIRYAVMAIRGRPDASGVRRLMLRDQRVLERYNDELVMLRDTLHIGAEVFARMCFECALPMTDDDGVETLVPLCRRVSIPPPEHKRHRRRPIPGIALSGACWVYIEQRIRQRERMSPVFGPMTIEPLPWSQIESVDEQGNTTLKLVEGGYAALRTPLMSRTTPAQKRALRSADLRTFLDHFNALAVAPLRINPFIAEWQKRLFAASGAVAGLPRAEPLPLPPRPPGYDETAKHGERWAKVDPAVRAQWSEAVGPIIIANKDEAPNRVRCLTVLGAAHEWGKLDRFYLPMKCDGGGRQYTLTYTITYQGDDQQCSLLEWGRPVDAGDGVGFNWVMIHCANSWEHGVEKLSFKDRIGWVRDHLSEIERCGRDPGSSDWWMGAESPWRFLAACRAIVDPEAAARLMVGIDGTSNGLQHYSMMLRDAEGGRWVNLEPSSPDVPPANMYLAVCEAAKRKPASAWRGDAAEHITRPRCKTQIIAQLYGGTAQGARQSVYSKLCEEGHPHGEETRKLAHAIVPMVRAALADLCPAATAAMAWLSRTGSAVAKAGEYIRWTTPLGLPVLPDGNEYRSVARIQVRTSHGDFWLPKVDMDKCPPLPKKYGNATAARFIHSFDATHSLMRAKACRAAGIDSVCNHDKYFSHAANVPRHRRIVLETMVGLYRENHLDRFYREVKERFPSAKIEPPPAPIGTLDLDRVIDSVYSFS